MPTPTYTQISSITLASNSATVTFSNLPQNYKDLVLVTNLISAGTYASSSMRINGDSGTNYPYVWAVDGQSCFSGTGPAMGLFWSGWAVNGNISNVTHFMDYSSTDKHKQILTRLNKFDSEGNSVGMSCQRWSSNSPVTSLQVYSSGTYSNPWAVGTTLTLYGIVG